MKFDSKKPIFIQIAEIICEKILKNELKVNEKIPSIRELATELEVNPNTVVKAYNHLQDLKIIGNKRGLGYYVSTNGLENTLNYLKNEFFNYELPLFFKKVYLLKIDINELINRYENFLNSNNHEDKK